MQNKIYHIYFRYLSSIVWSTRVHLSMMARNCCIVEKVFSQIISQLDFSSAIILNLDYVLRAIICAEHVHNPSCAAHKFHCITSLFCTRSITSKGPIVLHMLLDSQLGCTCSFGLHMLICAAHAQLCCTCSFVLHMLKMPCTCSLFLTKILYKTTTNRPFFVVCCLKKDRKVRFHVAIWLIIGVLAQSVFF